MKNRPQLAGLNIWVAGPKVTIGNEGPDKLCELLQESGANPLHYPLVQLVATDDMGLNAAIRGLGSFATLVFVSSAGVRFFLEHVSRKDGIEGDLAGFLDVGEISLVAIGPGTVTELERNGLAGIQMPELANSQSLAELLKTDSIQQPILIVRADRGSDVLREELEASGVEFTQVAAYKSIDIESRDESLVSRLTVDNVDWVVVTSAAIAGVLGRLYGELIGTTKIACISRNVAEVVEAAGLEVTCVASEANFLSLREAIEMANER